MIPDRRSGEATTGASIITIAAGKGGRRLASSRAMQPPMLWLTITGRSIANCPQTQARSSACPVKV